MDASYGLPVNWLYYVSCILNFSMTFIMKGCWTLSQTFSASIELIISCLSFSLFTWWSKIFCLPMLNHPWISGMKPTWSWLMLFLMCSWIQLQEFYWEFCIYVHKGNWPAILFVGFLCGLGFRVTMVSYKEFGNVPSVSVL